MRRIEHGRSAWLRGRCRCSLCHRELLHYSRVRRAAQSVRAGRPMATRVTSAPARRRVVELAAAGWTQSQIAEAAGVSLVTVWRIQSRPTIAYTTARAVLALSV